MLKRLCPAIIIFLAKTKKELETTGPASYKNALKNADLCGYDPNR